MAVKQQKEVKEVHSNPYQVKYEEYLDHFDKIDIEKKVLDRSVYMHWHEFCELELVFDGEGIQRKKNVPKPFSKGVLSLQLPMDFHEVIVNNENPPELYSVKFVEMFISPKIYQAVFSGKRNQQITLTDENFENVKADFEQLYTEFNGNGEFREILLKNILEKIIIQYHRYLEAMEVPEELTPHTVTGMDYMASYNTLIDCMDYIQNNFNKNITLTEMAERANMSQNYFSTFFRQSTGCTFRDYLKNVRIRYALSFLTNSELPVYKVSEMAGFASCEHFSRLFTKEVGISPSNFRKQLNEKRLS
ncbi:MAG: AraC family transcriptional regulator [Eubacteriales bacterium]|nr:AraC family transcriptional regulator [Eubacteriales bacterium]